MHMKLFICSLSLSFFIFDKFVPILSQSPEGKNAFVDMVIGRVKSTIEKSLSRIDQGQNIAAIYFNAIACVMQSETLVCNVDNTHLKSCLTPEQEMLDMSGGTRYEGYANMLIGALITGKDFICNSRVMDILEIFNPCLHSNLKPILRCWGGILPKLVNGTSVTNLKEEYCKAFKDNKICTIEELTSHCNTPSTKLVMADMYDAFFIQSCNE